MTTYTNKNNIPISVAVWLATDNYPKDDRTNLISATSLLKPIREILLTLKYPETKEIPKDVSTLLTNRVGSAIHNDIEAAWEANYEQALKDLGYPQKLIDTIALNPTDADIQEAYDNNKEINPIYTEHRTEKEFNGWIISGEFDFASEGIPEDFKWTKVFSYMKDDTDINYILQMSIYKWLHNDKITQDKGKINYLLQDFAPYKSYEKGYPPADIVSKPYKLMSLSETEAFIANQLKQIDNLKDKPQSEFPLCNATELWKDNDIWKYYKDPAKKTRSTKNFTNPNEANAKLAQDGYIGEIIHVKAQAKKCRYCSVVTVCDQAKQMLSTGELKL